jgi:hypothetical protein
MKDETNLEEYLLVRSRTNLRKTSHTYTSSRDSSSIRMKNIFKRYHRPNFMKNRKNRTNHHLKKITRGNLLEKKHFLTEIMGKNLINNLIQKFSWESLSFFLLFQQMKSHITKKRSAN